MKNKVIIITGSSSGLGEATARHLAEKGAIVAATIARAIEQPADVDINEIVIRPTVQEF